MRKILLSAALAAAAILASSGAHAFPAPAKAESSSGNLVQVRGLCGLGWHRGAYGACVPNGTWYPPAPYPGYYAYGYGPRPVQRCWWVGTAYGPRRVCAW